MRIATPSEVRATIAAHILGATGDDARLGEITLHPHQRAGITRVARLLEEHGGALLADDVGLGKTFVALALARQARDALVIGPASLRGAWTTAANLAGVCIRFVSVERLGGNASPDETPDLVIVDEAHHLRNAATRRYAAASAVCAGARVLLISATPIQNRLADLRTILALFLGTRAIAMSPEELARFIVRRVEGDLVASPALRLPRVDAARWMPAVNDVDCLDRLIALPPPLAPADGDDGGVLLTYTLVRQWSSSRATLESALRRRLARAHAMEDALVAGRLPTRAELTAWAYDDGIQQLSFPELIHSEAPDAGTLLDQVRRHATGVRGLLDSLRTSDDPDAARAQTLRDIVAAHDGERAVAFSEYTDTVAVLYRRLAPTVRAAMLTHHGGRVAGGTLSRRELLARFAPGASSHTIASERIDLLLTTDVLSEGVNLQDASVLVHLDLTWNPARLEQRLGRLRRIGASRDSISVYMSAPPAPAERLLRLGERLRLKLRVAANTLGIAGAILPGLAAADADAATPREERIASVLHSWARADHTPVTEPVAAAITASGGGAIACIRSGGSLSLVAVTEQLITDSRLAVEDVLSRASGDETHVSEADLESVRVRIERWLMERDVSRVLDLSALRVAHGRRALLNRVEGIARRTARHTRPQLTPLMRAARSAATITLSAGAERVLDELTRAPLDDHAWLQAVGEFAAIHHRKTDSSSREVLALLILRQT